MYFHHSSMELDNRRPNDEHQTNQGRYSMGWLFVISSNEPETVYNAVRLANVSLKKNKEVTLFMLGRGVEFNEISTEEFDINSQLDEFYEAGGELIV